MNIGTSGAMIPGVGAQGAPYYMPAAGVVPYVARGLMTAVGVVSTAKVMRLIKAVGLGATAAFLGVDLANLVGWWTQKKMRAPRRARGISGADMRRTKRTIAKVNRMHAQLAHAYGRTAGRHTTRGARVMPPTKVAIGRAAVNA